MKFVKRAIPLPANYRFFYQLAIFLLILEFSCPKNKGVSTLKLQLLAWALRDNEGNEALEKVIKEKSKKDFNFWALDPALNRATKFALADGFLVLEKEKFMYTEKGKSVLQFILDNEIFTQEKSILKGIGKSITETFITSLLKKDDA
ncbi:MAG: hypothetical protein PHP00_10970 [Thiotrichaceae bacterium]|nr:hypothetical protein [Thiotrichaceae bacterium]